MVDADTGQPIPFRLHLRLANGRPVKLPRIPYWHDHMSCDGELLLRLNKGNYGFEIERGPEYINVTGHFIIENFAEDSKQVALRRIVDMTQEGWWAGDLNFRRRAAEVEPAMRAEDLYVCQVIASNKSSLVASGDSPPNAADETSSRPSIVQFDGQRFYHLAAAEDARAGGAAVIYHLRQPLAWHESEREYPSSIAWLKEARQQMRPVRGRGLNAARARPSTDAAEPSTAQPPVWIDVPHPYAQDLPLWLAAGLVDSIGLAGPHLHRGGMAPNEAGGKARNLKDYPPPQGLGQWSQHIYYQVLNAGLRIPPSAGSGSGEAPNPAGYNRIYVHLDSEMSYDAWWEGFRLGRAFVTNGPLLRPKVEGHVPGHIFEGDSGETLELEITADLATRDKLSYLEVVRNGRVVEAVHLDKFIQDRGKLPKLRIDRSGWFLIRAVAENNKTYRFASTAPYYVEIGDRPYISRKAVQFFLDWTNQRIAHLERPDVLKNPAQREEVLNEWTLARAFWEARLAAATAE